MGNSVLDDKINKVFAGCVVRKDLVKTVKGNAAVPSYVLEYLLGQYCATNDDDTIKAGIKSVKDILEKHHVDRSKAGFIKSQIQQKGRYKVIDKVFATEFYFNKNFTYCIICRNSCVIDT